MTSSPVLVDAAGGQVGGAARFRIELLRYLQQSERQDVKVIGATRRIDPAWLAWREMTTRAHGRRIALNNISFVSPGSERWVLLRNLTDFLTDEEMSRLDYASQKRIHRRASVVHYAAKRAERLVVPCTAMAQRVSQVLPEVAERVVVRHHPVSSDSIPRLPREPVILCPVVFLPYKNMIQHIAEFVVAMEDVDASIRLLVTANREELPQDLAEHKRIQLIGHLDHSTLRRVWARSSAIFFPPGIESFGYPLAEARASGHPVIARETDQSREIAGAALCGFMPGNIDSLRRATLNAMVSIVEPDPAPFDPLAYFKWLLGPP